MAVTSHSRMSEWMNSSPNLGDSQKPHISEKRSAFYFLRKQRYRGPWSYIVPSCHVREDQSGKGPGPQVCLCRMKVGEGTLSALGFERRVEAQASSILRPLACTNMKTCDNCLIKMMVRRKCSYSTTGLVLVCHVPCQGSSLIAHML